jgi:hypothetical protein
MMKDKDRVFPREKRVPPPPKLPFQRFWVRDESLCVQLEEQKTEPEGVMSQQAAINRAFTDFMASPISDINTVNMERCLEVSFPVLACPNQLLSRAMFWIVNLPKLLEASVYVHMHGGYIVRS